MSSANNRDRLTLDKRFAFASLFPNIDDPLGEKGSRGEEGPEEKLSIDQGKTGGT
jgi:hypothetical protein